MKIVNDYTVIDTETTGLCPSSCKIIEISASRIRNGIITETYTSLVNPGCQLPYYISDLTGITDDMVCDKPCFNEIAEEVKTFIGNDVIVGHNVIFDMRFLNASFGSALPNHTIDTLTAARRLCPGLNSYKLEALCKQFNLSDKQLHRAESDVYLTFCLYEFLKLKLH